MQQGCVGEGSDSSTVGLSGEMWAVSSQPSLTNLVVTSHTERFSLKYRKTKTKVVTLANHK